MRNPRWNRATAHETDGHNPRWTRVAFLVIDGFEERELTEPKLALARIGVEVVIVSPKAYVVQSFNYIEPGEMFQVDMKLGDARPNDFDALVIPGGVINSDHLRADADAIRFIHAFMVAGKPVAAIGHAPWVLIDAHDVSGRTVTASKTVRIDLADAGAHDVDREVVIDGNLITSRGRDDLPAFCDQLVKMALGTVMDRVPDPAMYSALP
jgi:protease I